MKPHHFGSDPGDILKNPDSNPRSLSVEILVLTEVWTPS